MTAVAERSHMGRSSAQIAIVGVLFLCAGNVAAQPIPVYRIVDSGYYVDRLPPTVFGWADNERFVFKGVSSGERNQDELASPLIKVWDTTKNSVTPHKDVRNACFKDGRIRYSERGNDPAKSGKHVWWEGPLGEEKRFEQPYKLRTNNDEYHFSTQAKNPFHCRSILRNDLDPPVTDVLREVIALRDGDGYLTAEVREMSAALKQLDQRRGELESVVWYHHFVPDGLSLPVEMRIGSFYIPRVSGYSEYAMGYVIPGDQDNVLGLTFPEASAQRVPYRVFLFRPTKRQTEIVDIPRIVTGVEMPLPTVAGWVFAGGGLPRRQDYGFYKFDGKKVETLGKGLVSGIAVSRDGCRAVYRINTEYLEMASPIRVKLIDFCRTK